MKKRLLLLFFVVLYFSCNKGIAQVKNSTLLLEDSKKIVNAYVAPAIEGIIYAINDGWFHTAKVHKKFGFDITVGFNGSFVPTRKEMFNIRKLGLQSKIINAVPDSSPTLFGSGRGSLVILETKISGTNIVTGNRVENLTTQLSTNLPNVETNISKIISAPNLQLTIGLPWKLETSIRFIPKVEDEDSKSLLFGIGFKKEITSLLGPMGKSPFHLAIMANYSNLNSSIKINNQSNENSVVQNSTGEVSVSTYAIQAIGSLNFPIIDVYGALGYGAGNASFDVFFEDNASIVYNISDTAQIRADLENYSQKFKTGSFRALIGTRLSLDFFKIFASYALQEYNTLSIGLALSFR